MATNVKYVVMISSVGAFLFMPLPKALRDLSSRLDDYSLQITSPQSPRFFVRATKDGGSAGEINITDFLLSEDDDTRAFTALGIISEEYTEISRGSTIRFLNISPASDEKAVIIARHDRIISIMRQYLNTNGLTASNTYLNQRYGKYETVVIV